MYKLISIVTIISLLGIGCSVLRKGAVSEVYSSGNIQDSVVLSKVLGNNIEQLGYFIKRADIEVTTNGQQENIVAVVRFRKEGDYLISLKSKTGIEAARIFIGKDTLMINDRINKILYVGSPEYIERRFSIPESLFPIIFGDFVSMNLNVISDTSCIDGRLNYSSRSSRIGVSYVVDCKISKIVNAVLKEEVNNRSITLLYSDFQRGERLTYPGKIEVSGLPDQIVVKIEIRNIEFPWSGEMSFIPGTGYEIEILK